MLYAGGAANPEDDPFVINPARYDPDDTMAHQFSDRTKAKVLCPKTTGELSPPRFICVDVVVVVECNILQPVGVYQDNNKLVKQLVGIPMRGENERAGAFFGTVFGHDALQYIPYGIITDEGKVDGIAYRTVVANSGVTGTPKKGMSW